MTALMRGNQSELVLYLMKDTIGVVQLVRLDLLVFLENIETCWLNAKVRCSILIWGGRKVIAF